MKDPPQYSNANTGYGPNCLTHEIPNFRKGMDYIFILYSIYLALAKQICSLVQTTFANSLCELAKEAQAL